MGLFIFVLKNINNIIKIGGWLGMGILWVCCLLKCIIVELFSGCKFYVEVMLMCKYNLFIIVYKNKNRELFFNF